jgi:hypothetical protein
METKLFVVGNEVVPDPTLTDDEIRKLGARVHIVQEFSVVYGENKIRTDIAGWVDATKFVLSTHDLDYTKRLNRIFEEELERKARGRTADALWTQTLKDAQLAHATALDGIPVSDKPREVFGLGVTRIQTSAVPVVQAIHAVYQNLIEARRSMEKLDDSVRKLEEDLLPILPELAVSMLYPEKSPELVDTLRPGPTTTTL